MNLCAFRERKLALAALLLLVNMMSAQLRESFSHLGLPLHHPNGFFFPQSYNTVKMPNAFADYDTLNASQCAALFMSMGRASLDSTHVLTDFSDFREHKDSVAHSAGCYSIALMDLLYLDFQPDALSNGLIYRQDGKFYPTEGCAQSPCVHRESCVLWVDAPHIRSRVYHFLLSEESFISNYEHAPDSMVIDFDDGLGWRMLHSNVVYDVDYTTDARNRVVRCRLYREGRMMKSAACQLKSNEEYDVCSTVGMPFPVQPPWPSSTDNPWDVQVEFESEWVRGRAYTLYSTDGVFDKPFLFVEGIDFGLDRDGHPIHDWTRHGTFGWCEFASGFQDPNVQDDIIYGYDDLHLMPELLQAVLEQGYDIVMIDFYDGATWLQRNSALLQHVIRLCNEYKHGDESLVIAGASMGGVLSRHALRTMELNGEDHCARLWISMDAPHEGAHIPLSLQYAIRFSANHGQEQAQLFRDRYLLRPAARQMLDAQLFHSLGDYEAWYTPLREMGYPRKCRSVAISNGLANGQGLSFAQNEIINWECDAGGLVHSKVLLLPEDGDPNNALSAPGYPVLAHFRSPVVGGNAIGDEWYFWFGALVLGVIDAVDIDEEVVHTPEGMVNRDYAAGGKRNTTQVFVAALNAAIDNLNNNDFNAAVCQNVTPDQFNPNHTFVLTSSSVGVQHSDPEVDINEYLWSNPEENHFDRVWFAQNQNENHTELTETNVGVVLEEVLAYDLVELDTALTSNDSNSGVFNFGRPEYSYLKSIHVHQQGRLRINAYQNTHFNESSDYLSVQSHFEVRTQPCSAEVIRVDAGGFIEIGDAMEEYRTGQLTIGRDSRLVIGAGGDLTIYPGSSLVIEEGGVLEVFPGGKLSCRSGNLIVKAGGICRFLGQSGSQFEHRVALSGSDARWLFDGGQLHLDVQTTLSMDQEVDETGYLEIYPGTQNMLHMQPHALLKWKGHDSNDLILKITNGAHLQNANWMQGGINLSDGLVDLTYHGAIYTDVSLHAQNVHFYASDIWEAEGSELWKWYGLSTFTNCVFDHVDLHAQQSKTTLSGCMFNGPNAGFHAYQGAYSLEGTIFNQASCASQDLEAMSVVADCSFMHDAAFVDWSNQRLIIKRCDFSDITSNPIDKVGGSLSLQCNSFENTGAIIVGESTLDMSTARDGGMNSFRSVENCIRLNNAYDLFLLDGGNDFSGCTSTILQGSIDTLCGIPECDIQIQATHNHWGFDQGGLSSVSGLSYPPQDRIHLVSSEPAICGGYEAGVGCELLVSDTNPTAQPQCMETTKVLTHVTPEFTDSWTCFLMGTAEATNAATMQLYDSKGSLVVMKRLQVGDMLRLEEFSLSMGVYLVTVNDMNNRTSIIRLVE